VIFNAVATFTMSHTRITAIAVLVVFL